MVGDLDGDTIPEGLSDNTEGVNKPDIYIFFEIIFSYDCRLAKNHHLM